MSAVDFEGWYRETHPRLSSSMAIVAGEVGVAAEVVDEAFARAYERWDRVGAMASPAGWTYRTALNVLRRKQRRAAIEERIRLRRDRGGEAASPPASWSPEIWDALLRLPRRERTAVALRYVADCTTDEIAAAMGVAPGTVGSTLHAARRNLAVALGDDTVEGDLEEVRDV